MKRRELLEMSVGLGSAIALLGPLSLKAAQRESSATNGPRAAIPNPLRPPSEGDIPVAFLISDGAVVIDFAGPWEVFEGVHVPGHSPVHPFRPYTVAETAAPVHASGGMIIVPNYSFASAPMPKVLVIPAQSDPTDAVIAWVRNVTRTSDVTMSVCTGAFLLAKTGLLNGKSVATHHGAYAELAMSYPDVFVKRGARFVESGNLASSGGLSSGIDLALHVVERYFGHAIALSTADNLEYQGQGWMDADSNQAYAARRVSTEQHPLCAVCDMDVNPAMSPKSTYRGHTYYFCMDAHKKLFDAGPDRFIVG
jgi:transcriptional regulator GlxA family with amidase domain